MGDPSIKKPLIFGCGIVAAIGILVVITIIIWMLITPESGVKLHNEIDQYALEYMENHNILKPAETPIAYYDNSLTMDGSEAAILTNMRVIYVKDERVSSVSIANITNVEHEYVDYMGDIIEIESADGYLMKIEIAPYNMGKTFYDALMDVWNKSKEQTGAGQ
jgi:hypothetical protein